MAKLSKAHELEGIFLCNIVEKYGTYEYGSKKILARFYLELSIKIRHINR